MSGPFVWWANRKSRIGMTVAAKAPPHVHGKPWWTTPPTTLPQPEHIEYVAQYVAQLYMEQGSDARNAMLKHAAEWMRSARRLLHEEARAPQRADLHTTDGLIVAADKAIQKTFVHRARDWWVR